MNSKEQLEYRKQKLKELMTILKDLKKLKRLTIKAKEVGMSESMIIKLSNKKAQKSLKIETIEKYIDKLK